MAIELYEHPDYVKHAENWRKYRALYTGDRAELLKPEYLWPHEVEQKQLAGGVSSKLRRIREQRTRYLNICEIIVSLWTSFFWRSEPTLDDEAQKLLGDAVNDIDGRGTSLYTFLRNNVSESFFIYGRAHIYTDSFPGLAKNRAEELARGIRPYWQLLEPLQVKDYDIEYEDSARLGKYNAFRYEFARVGKRPNLMIEPAEVIYTRILDRAEGGYTATEYTLDGDEWKASGQPPLAGALDELPIASMTDSVSWLKDVAEETLRHYNLRSAADNIRHYQGYQRLYSVGIDPNDVGAQMAMTENVIAMLPRDAKLEAIPPISLGDHEEAQSRAIENAFRMGLNQLRQMPLDSGAAQSADTIEADKDDRLALIRSTLEQFENLANTALQHYAAFAKPGVFNGSISLDKDIKDDDFNQFITTYQAFADIWKKYPQIDLMAAEKAIKRLQLDKNREEEALEILAAQLDNQKEPVIAEEPETDDIAAFLSGI